MEWSPAAWVEDARAYLTEVRAEFNKITWPSREEYVGGTIGVLVVVAIVSLVLGVSDFVFNWMVRWVLP